jgi:hypothetical protein
MIRSELVQLLANENPALSIREIDHIVSVFFDEITAQLVKDGRVELRGFGAFSTRSRWAVIPGQVTLFPSMQSAFPISSPARKCAPSLTFNALFARPDMISA